MASEPSRLHGLGRAALVVALFAGVPAVAVASLEKLQDRPHLAFAAVLVYELALVVLGFAAAVFRILQGRWANRTADAVDGWLQRRTSRFTRAYLRYVRASTRYMDVKGLSTAGEYTLEMRDVLVTLSLVSAPVHSLSPDPVRPHIGSGAVTGKTIWHWLRRAEREQTVLSIIGPPGCGKTTLLRYVAFVLAKGGRYSRSSGAPRKIPILVNLREHRSWSAENGLNLTDLLRRSLVALDRQEPPSWVETNLRRGNFAILLDGLDEMPDQEVRVAVTNWIEQQSSGQAGNLLVLTSRPFGYRDNPVGGAIVVEVQAFTEEQISSFIRQWYVAVSVRSHGASNESSRLAARLGADELLARLDETPSLFELTANPLLLTMIANVHQYRGALPGSRAELYEEICDVFLGKRHQARGVAVDMPSRQRQAVLRNLAYAMTRQGISEVTAKDAANCVGPALARVSKRVEPADFLRSVEDSSGLLIEKERGVYAFAHLTFQEYLTADFIRESGRADELVANLDSAWWRETIRLYAAISDATVVVDACLDRRTEPALLALAVQCVEEAHEIAQETRVAVDACVNPPDARENAVHRHTAAMARLQLRTGKDIALKKSRFIGRPITWLEYQYFIDSQQDTCCFVPDHWSDRIYPAGQENEPAVGIRYEDALKFCEWMDSQLQSAFRHRPPRADEIDTAIEREGWDSGMSAHGYWTTTQVAASRDGRFWPLLRNAGQGRRYDPYPLTACRTDRRHLDSLLTADLQWIQDSENRPALQGILLSPSSVAMFASPAATMPLPEMLRRCWPAAAVCDVGQLRHDVELAEKLVRQYFELNMPGEAADIQERLVALAHQLTDLTSQALDRGSFAERRDDHLVQLRRLARLTALEAAGICTALYVVHGGSVTLPPRDRLPRPTRKVPLRVGYRLWR